MSRLTTPLTVCVCCLLASASFGRTILYVDADATGPAHGGSTWCQAYTELYDALAVATYGTTIRVADGTHKPDVGSLSSPRYATFFLLSGVTIEGGYAGCGAPDPDEREIAVYKTILSGDLNGDDGPGFANNRENVFCVVTASAVDETAVLDGFTIIGGNANESELQSGGGMRILGGNPTLTHCTFSGNSASSGGGMHNSYGDPMLINCTFSANVATSRGGGMYIWYGNPTLTNCTFSGNSAQSGGAMYDGGDNTTLSNCTFSGNSAVYGGAMYKDYADLTLTNCTFSGNSAVYEGGGMYIWNANPTVTNCTFSGNSAVNDDGGGIYSSNANPTLTNCILWGNSDYGGHDQSAQISGSGSRTYTCIEGWTGSGTGNIGRDPLFVDPDGADDILGTPDDDLRLLPFSPSIDAGNNTAVPSDTVDLDADGDTNEPTPLDLAGSPRFLDDPLVIDRGNGDPPIVDMGAYESADCGGNGIPDWDDITTGTSQDCNVNAVPDECEIAQGVSADCNENAIPDECDIFAGTSADCNEDTVPDECDPDCNDNGVPDDCDIVNATSADCNENGIPDDCDIAQGTSDDCDENGVLDQCEADDDGDGVVNECDECADTPTGLIIGEDGCAVPHGPCCFAGGPCIDNTSGAECALVGGTYWGDGLTCDGDPDGDWTYGCDDGCPFDPNKIVPGICGCGVADDDADGDGVVGCLDECPNSDAGLPVNSCGCPALGACCFEIGVCWDDVELIECTTIDGAYQGDGSTCVEGCAFGDLDADGDVDMRDLAIMQTCFGAVGAQCQSGSIHGCGDIDLTDFEAFSGAFAGP